MPKFDRTYGSSVWLGQNNLAGKKQAWKLLLFSIDIFNEGSSATDSVTDVTDVTDVEKKEEESSATDSVTDLTEGRRKREEGRGKK
ncbi:hypothetical protein QUA00_00760 [Microcoleus sp. T2B6]|uniref:hypothetical protein n=1 Tax=Microcoleus sp. T2B6 TaxID=3055424 RepID=UPI002FD2930B